MVTIRKTQDEVVKELLLWENVKKCQHQDDLNWGLSMLIRSIKEAVVKKGGGLFSSKKEEIDYQTLERMVTKEIEEKKECIALMDAKMRKLQSAIANGKHTDRLQYIRSKNEKMLLQAQFLLRHKPEEFKENVLANYNFYTELDLAEWDRGVRVSESIVAYLKKIQDAIEK